MGVCTSSPANHAEGPAEKQYHANDSLDSQEDHFTSAAVEADAAPAQFPRDHRHAQACRSNHTNDLTPSPPSLEPLKDGDGSLPPLVRSPRRAADSTAAQGHSLTSRIWPPDRAGDGAGECAAPPTGPPTPSSAHSSVASQSTFNSFDFGTRIHDCNSAELLTDTDSESEDEQDGRYGGFGAGGPNGRGREMCNYYDDYIKRNGGGVRSARRQRQRRPTAMDLVRMREGVKAEEANRSVNGRSGWSTGEHTTSPAASGAGPRPVEGRGRRRRVRDPVDPEQYVNELHRNARERARGGKIIIDADGEVQRLYPTQGWFRLKRTDTILGSFTSSEGEMGSHGSLVAGGGKANRFTGSHERRGHASGKRSSSGDGSRAADRGGVNSGLRRGAAQVSPSEQSLQQQKRQSAIINDSSVNNSLSLSGRAAKRQDPSRSRGSLPAIPAKPILVKVSSFARSPRHNGRGSADNDEEEDAAEVLRRQRMFRQPQRVSFAEDTEDLPTSRRGSIGIYTEMVNQEMGISPGGSPFPSFDGGVNKSSNDSNINNPYRMNGSRREGGATTNSSSTSGAVAGGGEAEMGKGERRSSPQPQLDLLKHKLQRGEV